MTKPHDEARIRKAVRQQIIEAIRNDIDGGRDLASIGGETLMKEVWEECGDVDEQRVAEDEMREIIKQIESRAT